MTNNKFIRNYYPLLIIVIGFVLILILGFFVFKFGIERGGIEETTKLSTSIKKLCKKYTETVDGISCEEAVQLALKKYPGNVQYVNKTQSIYRDRLLNKTILQDIWVVRIDLKEAVKGQNVEYDIEASVDKYKEVFIHKFIEKVKP